VSFLLRIVLNHFGIWFLLKQLNQDILLFYALCNETSQRYPARYLVSWQIKEQDSKLGKIQKYRKIQ